MKALKICGMGRDWDTRPPDSRGGQVLDIIAVDQNWLGSLYIFQAGRTQPNQTSSITGWRLSHPSEVSWDEEFPN